MSSDTLVVSKMNAVEHCRHIDLDLITSAIQDERNRRVSSVDSKTTKVKRQPKRSLTSTINNQHRRHWWKVCWVYNGNLLFDSLNQKYLHSGSRPSGAKLEPFVTKKPTRAKMMMTTTATLPHNLKISNHSQ